MFQTTIAGDVYQVIARLLYEDEVRAALNGVFGFTVNLSWVRQHYLPEFARQVAQIAGMSDELTVQVRDEDGHDLVAIGGTPVAGSLKSRQLPLLFADPLLSPPGPLEDISSLPLHDRGRHQSRPGRQAAFLSARRMALFTSGAVLALGVGFLMTARAIRIQARLAELRSDFVSTVTHNLKAPITSIRILGETLARRTNSADTGVRNYGMMLVQETLAAGAAGGQPPGLFTGDRCHRDLLLRARGARSARREGAGSFGPRLAADKFDVNVEIPDDLPDIRADSTALGLVLINLIDNAIRYSGEQKWLRITASRQGERDFDRHCRSWRRHPCRRIAARATQVLSRPPCAFRRIGSRTGLAERVIRDHARLVDCCTAQSVRARP